MSEARKPIFGHDTFRLLRLIGFLALLFVAARDAHAGGPEYVAGSTYFNPSTMGQPVTWSMGQIDYYTDLGDLSPSFPNASANALVADAFSQWTSVSFAALTATAAGQLAEDVNGGNIEVGTNGDVTAPADITPAATEKPVGVVYDYDGSATDALLGQGAGNASECFWNAAFGGIDNFAITANFLHALVVINGQCALQSSQRTEVEYRLVRVLGRVIGLGWSQLNLNPNTGFPSNVGGYPVMHYTDPISCVPITACYPNPYQPAPDDMAALSRLYPPNGSSGTGRIYGSIYFMNHQGNPGQPMQGVNVFACQYSPSSGVNLNECVSSVSGFLFTGNAGNPVTGWDDPLGNAYSEFGSTDQSVEGFFDLGGLPVPGGGSMLYQLSIEPLSALWSAGVGPYAPAQVAPSGLVDPMIVTVTAGAQSEQDLVMYPSAQAVAPWAASETWDAPAAVPPPGDWVGSLSEYGNSAFFSFAAQANRTLSVAVTAMNESGAASESKAEPVIGMWTLGDTYGTAPPALTTSPFNTETFGMTRLDAQVFQTETFLVGISDLRGDGRPDYSYHAHVLYGDSAIPARMPVSGGPITLQGIGFTPTLNVNVGNNPVPLVAANASQMLVVASQQVDGEQTVTVTDSVSGASSTMTGAVTFGAAATDRLILQQGANPPTPVGTQAIIPVTVRVVQSDGITPVNGATIAWSTSNGAVLSACAMHLGCSTVTDETGSASTWVTPIFAGNLSVIAQLAPAVYNPAQTVVAILTTSPSAPVNIAVSETYLWIAQGASVNVPLTAQVVDQNGNPMGGKKVNFFFAFGPGSLSAPNATTDSNGNATVTLTEASLTANFQVNACVASGNSPCRNIYGNPVSSALLNLQTLSGGGQVVEGSSFQPLVVRVTDSSTPPNSVLGASVLFQSTVMRPSGNDLSLATSNNANTQGGSPVILSSGQSTMQTNPYGVASLTPSVGAFSGTLEIGIQVSAGTSATFQDVMESFPESDFSDANPSSGNPQGADPLGRGLPREPFPVLRSPVRESPSWPVDLPKPEFPSD